MTLQQLFDIARDSYNNLSNYARSFHDNYLKEIPNYPHTTEETLGEIDLYIQALLFGVAAADGTIDPIEGQFIKQLPDYASFIPEEYSLNSGSDREFLKEMLMMAKKYSDHPPISLILMLKSVNEEHKAEFKEAFYGVFFNIFKAFASIDGKFDKKEIELAAKLVQPLDDMTK